MTIRKVECAEKHIIDEIVKIHLSTFEGFFLTFMGYGFLKQMYTSYTEHGESNLLVAIDNKDIVVGFLAYSENMSGLYKFMIKHHLIKFAWYSVGAFVRKSTVFMRLVRAFLKPNEVKREERYVELASLGVSPVSKNQGVGSRLIEELKQSVDFSTYQYITLETDVIDNEVANRFYQKNGFYIKREFITREGRKMYEYRYQGEKL